MLWRPTLGFKLLLLSNIFLFTCPPKKKKARDRTRTRKIISITIIYHHLYSLPAFSPSSSPSIIKHLFSLLHVTLDSHICLFTHIHTLLATFYIRRTFYFLSEMVWPCSKLDIINPSVFQQILWLYFIPLGLNSTYVRAYTPNFQYPFICWWTIKLISILCYNE